jgi:hypothetical protein
MLEECTLPSNLHLMALSWKHSHPQQKNKKKEDVLILILTKPNIEQGGEQDGKRELARRLVTYLRT